MNFDGEHFTYSTGYLNYLYQAAYYSGFWSGNGSIIPYDYDEDGLDSLADCNDTNPELGATVIDMVMESIKIVTVLMPIQTTMETPFILSMIVMTVTPQSIQVHLRYSTMVSIKTVMVWILSQSPVKQEKWLTVRVHVPRALAWRWVMR